MQPAQSEADVVFRSLADPTCRLALERLTRGPASVTELASLFSLALPSFLQHRKVLDEGGLVRSKNYFRVRTYQFEAKGLQLVERWLSGQRWFGALGPNPNT